MTKVMEIEQQILDIAHEKTRVNTEYLKQVEKVIMFGKKIMDHLGPHKLMFLEYESSVGILQKIYFENTYQIGLEDGKKLTQMGK
jgi:hypothetical protein